MNTFSLFDLPIDIIKEIMSYTSLRDTASTMLTCKYFYYNLLDFFKRQSTTKKTLLYETLEVPAKFEKFKNGGIDALLTGHRYYPSILTLIEDLTDDEAMQMWNDYDVVLNPRDELLQLLVIEDPWFIKHIPKPSKDVQLSAVQVCGKVIQYIDSPTNTVKIAAVEQNGNAIKYIKNPCHKVKIAAVKQNAEAIKYIDNPSNKIKFAAVENAAYVIEHIPNASPELQQYVIKKCYCNCAYIVNPHDSILLSLHLALKNGFVKKHCREYQHCHKIVTNYLYRHHKALLKLI